ncbi:uncharacterized protein N7482_002135 [Penicillium canariense]|uniref:Uncharacterized protein n=1 Tax=Penicillium canariense TaxID=189055 RepID=A0A9W9IEP5_9EURO|nr:uncharacterized protein N7482_002135 [Penicillium canariense]KAJ5176258.1 hypothetical protein N7482_002135 [Penicillium canariense]
MAKLASATSPWPMEPSGSNSSRNSFSMALPSDPEIKGLARVVRLIGEGGGGRKGPVRRRCLSQWGAGGGKPTNSLGLASRRVRV